MAIGTSGTAGTEASNIKGTRPKKVVAVVSAIGRKRAIAAERTLSPRESPPARRALIVCTMTRDPFTTTPVSATVPRTEDFATASFYGSARQVEREGADRLGDMVEVDPVSSERRFADLDRDFVVSVVLQNDL